MPSAFMWEWESAFRVFTPYDDAVSQALEAAWNKREPMVYFKVDTPAGLADCTVVFETDTSLQSGMQYTSITNHQVPRLSRRVVRITPYRPLGSAAAAPVAATT